MRLVGKGQREKYFAHRKDFAGSTRHEIHSAIKGMVNFAHLNLVDTNFPLGVDIIFCRNVVMYFDLHTMIRVMNKLRESLADDGYLFVGHSESLLSMPDRFGMEDWNDAIFYRRLAEEEVIKPAAEAAGEILDEVSRAQLEAEGEFKEKRITGEIESILVQTIKSIHMKEYDKALSLIGRVHAMDRNVIEPYYLAAEIYVNQGRFDEAKKQLSTILDLNQFFAPAYYLLGSICIEEGNPEQAKNSLRKSLYLDKDFAMAHFEMANVYRIQGMTGDAIRERRNTLNALERVPPGDIVAYSGGFNAMSLKNICISSIERLKTEG
jgi:chemotaxis protein methyltransferase CheR